MKFVDLFAGLGGFHLALKDLGHECVFVSELDPELQGLYRSNFRDCNGIVYGDIRVSKHQIPHHDILCAGFPCQPFSKSGNQQGILDKTRGTLFHEILEILQKHEPSYVILENVGNFERHDAGNTWKTVKDSIVKLGYHVRGTEHVASGGHGLISPHHFGFPHTRERFFVIASRNELPPDPFPRSNGNSRTPLNSLVQSRRDLSRLDLEETSLTRQQTDCINHWNYLINKLSEDIDLPSFPIWGDEILATYPFTDRTPYTLTARELRRHVTLPKSKIPLSKEELLLLLPSYARVEQKRFPHWKVAFIEQNREWFDEIIEDVPLSWIAKLQRFPPSLRKLEWNCQGEERDLWRYVLQFRPSGLRVKRYDSCPALVAMTTTQVPILGPKKRFITRVEALRLQGFPDGHELPRARPTAFQALGNAVHVEVVKEIAKRLLGQSQIKKCRARNYA